MQPKTVFWLLAAAQPLASALPHGPFGLASWDIEGFARDNPLGPTTGGDGGPTVTVGNADDLRAAVTGDEAKTILVSGPIRLPSRVKIGSNKSVIGVGNNATITGSGIDVTDVSNVILRNLKISHILGSDCITIRNSTRVWVDHNEFESDISQGPDTYVCSVPLISKL